MKNPSSTINFDPTLARLDELNNKIHGLAAFAQREKWPPKLQRALDELAEDVETIAGKIDAAAGNPRTLKTIITEAEDVLPRGFQVLGRALVRSLRSDFNAVAPVDVQGRHPSLIRGQRAPKA